MNIPWWRTEISEPEKQELLDTFDKKLFSYGPVAREFEGRLSKFLDSPYVMTTTSGSTALLVASMNLNLGSNDEVIVPNRTFHATAHAAMFAGAKIVLADCENESPIVDCEEIERKITEDTKAIYVVHLNGRAAKMDPIMKLAHQYNLKVIEDAAQAFGACYKGKALGTFGDFGCFSFGMTKLLATGQGGVITCKTEQDYNRCTRFISHGVKNTEEDSFEQFGFNFRYSDLHASIGLKQLDRFESKKSHVTCLYEIYEKNLRNSHSVQIIPVDIKKGELPLWMEVCSPFRDKLRDFLASQSIDTRKFLPSLQYSPYINVLGGDNFPNSQRFHSQGVFLPFGPDISPESVEQVCQAINRFEAML